MFKNNKYFPAVINYEQITMIMIYVGKKWYLVKNTFNIKYVKHRVMSYVIYK